VTVNGGWKQRNKLCVDREMAFCGEKSWETSSLSFPLFCQFYPSEQSGRRDCGREWTDGVRETRCPKPAPLLSSISISIASDPTDVRKILPFSLVLPSHQSLSVPASVPCGRRPCSHNTRSPGPDASEKDTIAELREVMTFFCCHWHPREFTNYL
jgi:hypothetical protein